MQFSYRVSEAEYLQGSKLRAKGGLLQNRVKRIFFWVFIMVCLLMLWAVVQRSSQKSTPTPPPVTAQSDQDIQPMEHSTTKWHDLAVNVGPFLLIAGLWIFMLFQLLPRRVRRQYRNDPAMQGEYTIDLTPGALSIQNTSGFTVNSGWNIYDYWREGKDVVILVAKSGTYFIISLSPLSEPQRDEVRGILRGALPRK